ncbi:MAG: hypothetical protein V4534_06740 [Myxococcota bacterium]
MKFGFKDMQIAYLAEGIAGIEKIVDRASSPATLLRRVIISLKKASRDTSELEYYAALNNYLPKRRGRKVPAVGMTRIYRAQQIHRGEPFLHLPLGVLRSKKGDVLTVSFETDCIIVKKIMVKTY